MNLEPRDIDLFGTGAAFGEAFIFALWGNYLASAVMALIGVYGLHRLRTQPLPAPPTEGS